MTRLLHVSDNHGYLPKLLGNFDVVVHSGDISPNFSYDSGEQLRQMYWWEEHMDEFKEWLQGHPFLFTLGNHDFMDGFKFEGLLQHHGIDATCLHDQIHTFKGINFYGFPYVPPINGKFNFETDADEMAMQLDHMASILNKSYVDVIVAHCPIGQYLDLSDSNKRFGNSQMNSFLDYKLQREMMPSYYLTGHVHSSAGLMMRGEMLISNAACGQHIIEI